MLVRFKKDWFGPGDHLRQQTQQNVPVGSGHLYTKTPAGAPAVELPEDFRELLHPFFADIVGEDDKPAVVPDANAPVPLSAFAPEFDDGFAAVQEKAEATRLAGSRKPPRSA